MRWPWYPTAIAVLIVLEPFTTLHVDPAAALRPLLLALVLGVLLTRVCVGFLGTSRGGAVASLVVVAMIAGTSVGRLALITLAITLLGVEAVWTRRGRMSIHVPWQSITNVLNVTVSLFLFVAIAQTAVLRVEARTPIVPDSWAVGNLMSGPDIFVLVADAHGRADVLAEDYGLGENQLASDLPALGFAEARDSWANHALTRFSFSVLLNGRPMSELGQDPQDAADDNLTIDLLGHSSGMFTLNAAGYETVIVSSGYEHLGLNNADRILDVGPRNELEQTLINGTAVGRLVDAMTGGYLASVRTRMLSEVDATRMLANEVATSPRFVLVHLPLPHWPFVMERHCGLRPSDNESMGVIGRDNHAGDLVSIDIVRDQTMCVDSLLVTAARDIVEARPSAVVLVMSDHGPEERLDWWTPTEPGLRDRMANLFWARTPGHPGLFPDDISLVNVMPILLNAYLGTSLPLHPNDLFFGPTPNNDHFVPYTPVTR